MAEPNPPAQSAASAQPTRPARTAPAAPAARTEPAAVTPVAAASYPELIRQLTLARRALDEEQSAARRWHREQLDGAEAAIAAAEDAVASADAEVAAAESGVARVDQEAMLLWRALGARLGRGGARRLGAAPGPAALDTVRGLNVEPGALLRRARARLDQVPAKKVRPLWLTAGVLLFGAGALALLVFLALARLA